MTTLAAVRTRLGLPDSKDDDWILRSIDWVTGVFQRVCNRNFRRTEGALQEFDACASLVLLRCYPVESVTSFFLQKGSAWLPVVPAPSYDLDSSSGVLELTQDSTSGRYRVIYTGGYVMPDETFVEGIGQTKLPAELEAAAIETIAHWYQRRDQLGLSSVSAGGGSVTRATSTLLPQVEETLQGYRRYRML